MSDEKTTEQDSVTPPEKRNPTGKGGFGDNPQNRNPGGWKKENSISYQYKRFMNMSIAELEKWSKTPKSERSVVEDIAFNRIIEARISLPDVKEITDRTEGKALQTIKEVEKDPVERILEGFGLSYDGQIEGDQKETPETIS